MISLKRFSSQDWDAYAGCERFRDGSVPLRGEIFLSDNRHVMIVVDFSGVHFYLDNYQNNVFDWGEWWTYIDMEHAGEVTHLLYQLEDKMEADDFLKLAETYPLKFRKL